MYDKKGQLMKTIKTGLFVNTLTVLKDGNLASGVRWFERSSGEIQIWSMKTYELLRTIKHTVPYNGIVLLGNGYLAAGSVDSAQIKIFNTTKGSLVRKLKGYYYDDGGDGVGEEFSSTSMVLLNDGSLASGNHLGEVAILSVEKREERLLKLIEVSVSGIYSMVVLGDGSLVTASKGTEIKIWQ